MKTVVTFGEVMMRLTPTDDDRLVQANRFDAHFGGSEYNVAAGIVGLGHRSKLVTRLPDNPIGHRAAREIISNGVQVTSDIHSQKGRMGIYYLEPGASPRPTRVVYDRLGSALALSYPQHFLWEEYFENASWFHVSGITPALNEDLRKATANAVSVASSKGIPISFDINYRAKLWTQEEARYTLTPLLSKCSVISTTEEDLERVFRIKGDTPQEIAEKAKIELDADLIAITLREILTVRRNKWSGCGISSDGFYQSQMYEIDIIDRVGAGDSFTAGLIAGMLDGKPEYAIDLAVAFSALKQTIPGDICLATREEADTLIKTGGAGRIQR